MKYVVRLLLYCMIFFITFTVSYTLVLRFIPVTITAMKLYKLPENISDKGIGVYSKWVPLEKINISMPTAVMASEDGNFLNHNGFDWKAIKQARNEYERGKRKRGGSTISQQLAKNIFCSPESTWVRKGFETYYTFLIENLWSKHRIMETYLNIIEVNPNVYGVEAAARRFYNKSALKLNAYEAAMIATVLPNPRRMNIAAPSGYMQGRAGKIRNQMAMLGKVDFYIQDDSKPDKKTNNKKK